MCDESSSELLVTPNHAVHYMHMPDRAQLGSVNAPAIGDCECGILNRARFEVPIWCTEKHKEWAKVAAKTLVSLFVVMSRSEAPPRSPTTSSLNT